MRKVHISAKAERDLLSILDYVSRDTARLAVVLVERLTSAALDLATSALEHSLVPRHEQTGLRRRVVGRYVIIYAVERNSVNVLHVVHGARNLAALLEAPGGEEP